MTEHTPTGADEAPPPEAGSDGPDALPAKAFTKAELDRMAASADRAAAFLKSLGHGPRLMLLCHLASGEKSVGELEAALGAPQAAVSQQLARLRHEGLVTTRREGKTIRYSLADERSSRMVGLLYELFCQAS